MPETRGQSVSGERMYFCIASQTCLPIIVISPPLMRNYGVMTLKPLTPCGERYTRVPICKIHSQGYSVSFPVVDLLQKTCME